MFESTVSEQGSTSEFEAEKCFEIRLRSGGKVMARQLEFNLLKSASEAENGTEITTVENASRMKAKKVGATAIRTELSI